MTHRFKKRAHSIYECKYHVVFCPKYRYRVFKNEKAEYVREQLYRLCEQKDQVEVLKFSTLKNAPFAAI